MGPEHVGRYVKIVRSPGTYPILMIYKLFKRCNGLLLELPQNRCCVNNFKQINEYSSFHVFRSRNNL